MQQKSRVFIQGENWMPVKSREDMYEVSDKGNIYSFYWMKNILFFKNKKGYLVAKLKNKDGSFSTVGAHRVVAQAFIPNPFNKPQVNHIYGNKEDNRVEKLEWATCKENIKAAYDTKLKSNAGEKHPRALFSNLQVKSIIKKYNKGVSVKKLSELHEVSYNSMWRAIKVNYKNIK